MCARVVEWTSRVFARPRARYDLAVPGTLRLLPTEPGLAPLSGDHARMRALFIAAAPAFETVMAKLGQAKGTVNVSCAMRLCCCKPRPI